VYLCQANKKRIHLMKKILLIATAGMLSCGGAEGDKATTADSQEVAQHVGETYNVDAATSTLQWKAYHKGGFAPRFGTLNGSGTVAVDNGTITGGSFVVDMSSLVVDPSSIGADEGKKATDLQGHLKSADFFHVDSFKTAKFEVTNVAALDTTATKSVVEGATNTISGNLTIKDKTVNLTFPAKVVITDTDVTIDSKFTINRQDWGLTYGTEEGGPADWGIAQEVDIEMSIKAKKII
jgi:polyisoprenoid-binding protein YceI